MKEIKDYTAWTYELIYETQIRFTRYVVETFYIPSKYNELDLNEIDRIHEVIIHKND